VAGGDEALLDDARRFADAASAAGTLVTLDIYQDMVHAFHLSALSLVKWPGRAVTEARFRWTWPGRPGRRAGQLLRLLSGGAPE